MTQEQKAWYEVERIYNLISGLDDADISKARIGIYEDKLYSPNMSKFERDKHTAMEMLICLCETIKRIDDCK